MFYQFVDNNNYPFATKVDFFEFPLHWHTAVEILYCLDGSFEVEINGITNIARKGQAVFIDSAVLHKYRVITPSTQTFWMEINPMFLKNDFQKLAELTFDRHIININAGPAEHEPPEISSELARLFNLIIRELQSPASPCGNWIISGCLFELSAFILREFPCHIDPSKKSIKKFEAIERVNKIIQYANENLNNIITINDAAMFTELGKSNFCKQFKKATQMSFHQYLNIIRINSACSLLFDRQAPVSVISQKAGFAEPKTFCRVFKKIMGVTPTEYRKKITGELK